MNPTNIAFLSFAGICAGTAFGMLLGARLPEHHLERSTKDVVSLAMAMIATMTALVLGLVTASAKGSFDIHDTAVKHTAAALLSLDRYLANYGPETKPIRESLRVLVMQKADSIWTDSKAEMEAGTSASKAGERLLGALLALTPTTEAQRWYQGRALDLSGEILQTRWVVFNGSGASIPQLFLIVIVGWLIVLFGSFGLFAPRNATAIGALFVCAVSVAASIFLILEMDDPFDGVMCISDAPIRYALSQMDR